MGSWGWGAGHEGGIGGLGVCGCGVAICELAGWVGVWLCAGGGGGTAGAGAGAAVAAGSGYFGACLYRQDKTRRDKTDKTT
ncbi:hypothetical protein V496_05740 [Pseudogymnoascus sp. VKM F-4515 (FW-2607)]|nr:hypothetical protein V496_05740 [Pseudogymnoascus sp. VKM F-4515 (FW-2607)]KFY88730.1 hypothetical protein V498_06683 [Pseudogymnoascus sp. VKM F-4517 (FW-2822)]